MSKDVTRRPAPTSALGIMLVALVVVFMVAGYYLDRWLHTTPWLMVGGVFVGAGLGFVYAVLVLLAGSSRKGDKGDSDSDAGPDKGGS